MVISLPRLVVLVTVCLNLVTAYPDGAPYSTCWTMFPMHGASPQQGPSPFTVTFSPTTYAPGNDIVVTISGSKLEGLQVGVRRLTGNTEELVGEFTAVPSYLKIFTCYGGYNNMVTHRTEIDRSTVSMTWTAPSVNVGNVTFKMTLLKGYSEFWHELDFPLYVTNNALPVVASAYGGVTAATSLISDIDFGGCGDTKGCFFYPRYCTGDSCLAAMTYQYVAASDSIIIELYTKAGDNYVALGISSDYEMGHDETYACVADSGFMEIQRGYNPDYENARQLSMFYSDAEVKQTDGRIQCRFTMPKVSEVYDVIQGAGSLQYNTITYDHSKEWYVQLAWGAVEPYTDVIAEHENMPAQTDFKVNFRENIIHRGSAFRRLVQAHACFMIISWVFLTGIVTVLSRHYKSWMPDTKLCGVKVWFQLHRDLAFAIGGLTLLAFILVITSFGTVRSAAILHVVFGFITMGAVGAQLVLGLMRPDGTHKRRPMFNWAHRILGQGSHLLACLTIILLFANDYVNSEMKIFGFVAIAFWIVVQIGWHILLEVIRSRINRQTLAVSDNKANDTNGKKQTEIRRSKTESILMIIYICLLTLTSVTLMLAFLMY